MNREEHTDHRARDRGVDHFLSFRSSHPLTVRAFEQMADGTTWFNRLLDIDSRSSVNKSDPAKPSMLTIDTKCDVTAENHFDLIYVGGGLGTIHAAVMACVFDKQVAIFDRFQVGCTHRDWNISREELRTLVQIGLLTLDEMESVIEREYDSSFVKFFDGTSTIKSEPLVFRNVLDVAVSANRLLGLCREKLARKGVLIVDGCELTSVDLQTSRALTTFLRSDGTTNHYSAEVYLDASGISSGIARALNTNCTYTHCCPTVGTVSAGFTFDDECFDPSDILSSRKVNRRVGEILVTLEDQCEDGRQLIWEGFPSMGDQFVSYLFYYDTFEGTASHSLIDFYEVYFAKLNSYKTHTGDFSTARPLFGVIPSIRQSGWRNGRRTATNRLLLIGDSAGLSSPLTYCGFGSFTRNLSKSTILLDIAIREGLLTGNCLSQLSAFESNVSISANFGEYLVGSDTSPRNTVNSTMNLICDVLGNCESRVRTELFRDQLTLKSYDVMMSAIPRRHPSSYSLLTRKGVLGLVRWTLNYLGFVFTFQFTNISRVILKNSSLSSFLRRYFRQTHFRLFSKSLTMEK